MRREGAQIRGRDMHRYLLRVIVFVRDWQRTFGLVSSNLTRDERVRERENQKYTDITSEIDFV